MRHRRLAFALGLACAVAFQAPAWSQGAGAGADKPPPTDVQKPGTLSDKLSTTNGVIHPQANVDPGMGKAPPDPNAEPMPVIPPPGAGGGAAAAQPK